MKGFMLLDILADPKIVESVDSINQKFYQLNIELFGIWKKSMVFEWHWWVNAFLMIAPWVVWFIVRKKDSTNRLLFSGLFLIIMASYYDFIGMSLGLWGYNYKLIPTIPPFMPWDISLIPVFGMLFYQYKPHISPFIKGLLFAFIGAYIFEPLFYWLGIYNPKEWKHYYSFAILYVLYLAGNFFVTRDNFEVVDKYIARNVKHKRRSR